MAQLEEAKNQAKRVLHYLIDTWPECLDGPFKRRLYQAGKLRKGWSGP
jgi:hypothetical protein